jgi:hypothetical protein
VRSSPCCSRLLPSAAKGLVAHGSVRLWSGVPFLESARSQPAGDCLVVDVGVVSARPPAGVRSWGAPKEPKITGSASPGRLFSFLALADRAAWLDNSEFSSFVGVPGEDMRGFLLNPELLWAGVILTDRAFPRPKPSKVGGSLALFAEDLSPGRISIGSNFFVVTGLTREARSRGKRDRLSVLRKFGRLTFSHSNVRFARNFVLVDRNLLGVHVTVLFSNSLSPKRWVVPAVVFNSSLRLGPEGFGEARPGTGGLQSWDCCNVGFDRSNRGGRSPACPSAWSGSVSEGVPKTEVRRVLSVDTQSTRTVVVHERVTAKAEREKTGLPSDEVSDTGDSSNVCLISAH